MQLSRTGSSTHVTSFLVVKASKSVKSVTPRYLKLGAKPFPVFDIV
jgi:hypothetical protein